MSDTFYNPFDNAEIISIYSDSDAVTDGILVNTADWFLFFEGKPVNRLTQTAQEEICSYYGVTMNEGLCAKMGELIENCRVNDNHIFIDTPMTFWLMPNEVGGLTLLLPSDY